MFEYLLKTVEAIGCSLEGTTNSQSSSSRPSQHVSLSSINSIDYEPMVAHIVKHLTVEKQKKVLLANFDESLGCLTNLLKHIGCQPDMLVKSGSLTTINLSQEGLDWINVELPFVNNPTSVWKEGSATFEDKPQSTTAAGRIKEIVGGLKKLLIKKQADVLIVTGLESYSMTVSTPEAKSFLRVVEDSFLDLLQGSDDQTVVGGNTKATNVIFAHNRDLFDQGFSNVFESIGQLCHLKLFLAPNEGGFTKSITGQVYISGVEATGSIHYKKVSFKTHNKGMDFFETVVGV